MAGALDGIKVVEVNRLQPGAFCSMMLADMGAEVIRVTQANTEGDPVMDLYDTPQRQASNWLDRNKRWIGLDLKSGEGQKILRQLAADADVVIEGFRPGVMARLGVDYETLKAENPRLVYCALSGFGQDGPYRDRPSHDIDYIALAGVLNLIGSPEEPAIPMNLVADYAGASMHGALGIMFALFARERTGEGQMVDISYLDTTISLVSATPPVTKWLADGDVPNRAGGIFSGRYPYYAVYEDKDGKPFSIGSTEPWLFQNLCDHINRPDLMEAAMEVEDFLNPAGDFHDRVRKELQEIFSTKSRDEWFVELGEVNVCTGKVYDMPEVFADPHVRHRGMAVEIDHPDLGPVTQPGVAIKLSETPGSIRELAHAPGSDTVEVLTELGYDAKTIESLRAEGVIPA